MKRPALLIVLLLLGASAAYVAWQQYNKAPETASSRAADFQLSAEELFAAYDENESTAHDKFGGKLLEVTGSVLESESASDGVSVIILDAGHPIFGIKCLMAEPLQNGPELEQSVVVRGFCSGLNGDVELSRCTLQTSES